MKTFDKAIQVTGGGLRVAKLFRVLPKVLFLAAALFSLAAFFSCENSSDSPSPAILQGAASGQNASNPSPAQAKDKEQFITFRGSVRTGGALPASYAKALEGLGFGGTEESVEGLSKSARPDVTVNGTSIEHFAVATPNSGEPVEGTFASASSTTFEMPLAIGKTWNIVCGIRNVSGDKKIIMSDSFQMEVTVSNSVLSHVFTLTPYTETVEGAAPPSGDVALTVNFEGTAASGGASVSASWEDPAGGLPALDVEGLAPAIIKASGVPVGNHRLVIFFRDSSGVSVYESVQVVTVLNGLTTETWMPETGEAAFTSGGHFVVDNDVIQGAASDRIYVGKPAVLASNDSVRASDSNSGSAYSPLEHLQAAFNKIQSAGSASKDFKIFVSGEAVGNATLGAAVIKDVNARSITIEGLDGLDESSKMPKSALKGSGSGSVFTIASDVPVTIKNLKITGGNASDRGGGIRAKNGSSLTIESGTLITGNKAGTRGGGISTGGIFKMKGGEVSGNESGQIGGGIFFEAEAGSSFDVEAEICGSGALIKGNTAKKTTADWDGMGGGLYIGNNATVAMSAGEIKGNEAERGGGGVRISGSGAKFELSGSGKITGNTADAQGGGIDDDAAFEMTGGEISGNTAPKGGAVHLNGSYTGGTYALASFKIGGAAKIPCSGGEGNNDVYACRASSGSDDDGKYPLVQVLPGGFSFPSGTKAATLTPQDWQRGLDILEASSGDIDSYKGYFALTDGDFNFSKNLTDASFAKLKAPLYIKATGSDFFSASGTKSAPYRTLNYAVTKLSGGEPDTILIIGKVEEQKISSLSVDKCSALTIKGVADDTNPSSPVAPEIDADSHNTSALTLSASVPITIQNLKIKGGQGTQESSSSYGGGIYLQAGTLCLADGAIVTGNRATYGGGVYVKKGASLYMYGTALVGDSADTPATGDEVTGATWTNCANYASEDGGGIYSQGSVYLGYSGTVSGNLVPASLTGGVKRNLSGLGGGGIEATGTADSDRGVFEMRSGYVSYNKAIGPGGGIHAYRSSANVLDGEVSYNEGNIGGGLAVSGCVDATFGRDGGSGIIKENTATTTDAGSGGGAVSVSHLSSTSFAMKGVAKIPYGGAEKNNDVFLDYIAGGSVSAEKQAFIKISGALSAGSGATITMKKWQRGKQFLGVGGDLTALPDGVMGKFDFTDLGWEKELYKVSADNDAARINAPIYVASETASQRAYTHAAPSDAAGTNGNSYHPFKTIKAACSVMDDATQEYTIQIDGEIKGCQVLPDTLLKAKNSSDPAGSNYAKKVNLQSAGDSAATGGVINADLTKPTDSAIDNGSALTVNTQSMVIIERLTITGGNTTGNGGGLYAGDNASVELGKNTKIIGNKAAGNGGGIYVTGSTNYAVVCAHGGELAGVEIGNKDANADLVGSEDLSKGGNVAACGAGVYSAGYFTLGCYLTGFKSYTSGAYPTEVWICGNTATGTGDNKGGGGVYVAGAKGSFDLRSYSYGSNKYHFNYNYSAAQGGGGLYLASSNSGDGRADTIDEAIELEIIGNKTLGNGGGIFFSRAKNLTFPKNCLIESNEAAKGGGIYNASQLGRLYFTKSGGTIKVAKNKAQYGGGIYCTESSKTTLQYGTIGGSDAADANTATVAGGAVYVQYSSSNNFTMMGNAEIPPAYTDGSCVNNNDVYLAWYASSTATPKPTARIYIDETSTLTKTTVAAITPQGWQRGSEVLKASSTMTTTITNRFKMSQDDADWEKKPASGTTPTTAYIMMPVYVASSASTDTTRKHCASAPASGNAGTPSAPYAKISDAIAEAAASGADIVVDGTLSSERQYIGGSGVTADLKIRGYKETDATPSAAKLARSLSSADTMGNVLWVDAAGKNITIQDLEISGGWQDGSGGGIVVAAGAVNLGKGVVIKSNEASVNGGGVYVASGAKLGFYGDAVIGNSGATADSVSGYWAKLASDSESVRAQGVSDALSAGANVAANGGGVYNDGGQVYFGCVISANANGQAASELTGGLYANVATALGGGIYAVGTNYVGGSSGLICPGGNIKFNYAATSGGGIYCYCDESSSAMIARKCDISSNKSASGGGAYVAAGKKLSLTQNAKVYSNEATASGGGIYAAGTLTMANTVTIGQDTSGEAKPNTAATHGGAVYVESGAKFQMSGSACVPPVKDASKTDGDYYVPNQNDVFLAKNEAGTARAAITVGDTVLSAAAPVAALTLEEYKRGITIAKHWNGETLATGTNEKFATTEYDDEWKKTQASDNKSVTLESDVYVASSASTDTTRKYCSAAPSSGNTGTKRKPYKSIEDALAVFNDDTADAKVIVDGTLTGAQKIVNATAKWITVQGYRESDTATTSAATLNGGFTKESKGTTLTIDASGVISVTLRYLTITGGYASDSGGGVCVMDGSLANLAEGVVVTGNAAKWYGGGVFVQAGAALGVYANGTGTSVTIGKAGVTDAPVYDANAKPSETGINQAINGGGIYNEGELRFGGSVAKRTDGGSGATGSTYATGNINICGNVARDNGGGIYATGREYGGTSAYNATKIEAGTIKCNRADQGGGVYIAGGKYLYMNRGIFELNKAETSGGAVYQGGTFNLCGKSQMAATTNAEKTNDVYLPSGKLVTVYSSINTVSTNGPLFSGATITPESWTRGTQVLEKGSSLSGGLDADIVGKFTVSDSEWSPILVGSGTSATGKIDADIWVSSSAASDSTRSSGVGKGSDDNRGTKSQPYATIKKAVAQCWKGPNDTVVTEAGVTTGRTIHIDGTVQAAASAQQEIPSTITTGNASTITLLGSAASGNTPTLKAASGQRVLNIATAVPVRIQNLKITGASTTGSGAGIYASAAKAKLILGEGAVVSGNECNGAGGGVWFGGTGSEAAKRGTLIMESTAKIQSNKSNSGNGGGVYLENAYMYMGEKALVGDKSTYNVGATSSSKSNSAVNGGGIYASKTAKVSIGFKDGGSALDMDEGYGVCHNYASGDGGGVYLAAPEEGTSDTTQLLMGSGCISKNGAAANGGGVYSAGTVLLHTNALVGSAKFTASSTATATATANSNVAGGDGGGIYSVEGSRIGLGYSVSSGLTWTEKTLNTGYGVVGNYATGSGGGIYCLGASGTGNNMEMRMAGGAVSANCAAATAGTNPGGGGIRSKNSYTKILMTGGVIAKNKAANGGGVHCNGEMCLSGTAVIGDSSQSATYASSETACSNYATLKGGGVFVDDTGAKLYIGYKNSVPSYDSDYTSNGGIYYNYASYGGGVYVRNGTLYFAYGAFKSNGANYSGGGIHMSNSITFGKDAQFNTGSSSKQNGLYINAKGAVIYGITGYLPTASVVAKIEPQTYDSTWQILAGTLASSCYSQFQVFKKGGTESWSINSSGYLKKD